MAGVWAQQVAREGGAVLAVGVDAIGQLVLDLQPHLVALTELQRETVAAGRLVGAFRCFGYGVVVAEQADLESSSSDGEMEGKDVGAVGRRDVDTLLRGEVALPVGEDMWEGDGLVLSRV